MFFHLIIIIIIKISLSEPHCQEGSNFCLRCHPITQLCVKCEKDIYIPNESGGCKYSNICIENKNYCYECNKEGDLCKKCEESYFPDENGGCSYTNNCKISYKGECLKCKEDFILVGKNDGEMKICKSLNSEDLKNCQIINTETGLCQECKSGYYLNFDEPKCSQTENCAESTFGICKKCIYGYYLNKKEQKCIKQEGKFEYCKESLDGKSCDVCDEDFYFDEEGNCSGVNYCSIRGIYYKCKKCIDGYFLSKYGDCCTKEEYCYYGNRDFGICTECIEGYLLDLKDGKCKSNLENNELKYCKIADGVCTSCEYGYYLGKDNKCSNSKYCSESDNGICIICEDNYYLGLDNRCIDVEDCIYSNIYYECIECDKIFYYNKEGKNCQKAEGKFENCKSGNQNGNCEKCKDDFYLNRKDYLCYSNIEKGPFYKCSYTDSNEEICTECIDNYYLGNLDNKCTTIEGCDLSENENKCLECDEYYCLNLEDNKCYPNYEIKNEKNKHFFNCKKTNEEGTKCAICLEGFNLNENGLCIDDEHCNYKEEGICKSCKNEYGTYCLNEIFGCVEIYADNCLECNQILDFGNCTKCEPGYVLNIFNQCDKQ